VGPAKAYELLYTGEPIDALSGQKHLLQGFAWSAEEIDRIPRRGGFPASGSPTGFSIAPSAQARSHRRNF
jgi:hypothetical protein